MVNIVEVLFIIAATALKSQYESATVNFVKLLNFAFPLFTPCYTARFNSPDGVTNSCLFQSLVIDQI